MFRIGAIALAFFFLCPLTAAETDDPEEPLGFSLFEHWYLNLSLESGISDRPIVPPNSTEVPIIPGLGVRYVSDSTDISWANKGFVSFYLSRDDEYAWQGLSFGVSSLFDMQFLKDEEVSFGFVLGATFGIYGTEVLFDRLSLHSFWDRHPPGLEVPFRSFVWARDGLFSVDISLTPQLVLTESFAFLLPIAAQASVQILPDLDLRYAGGVIRQTWSRYIGYVIHQQAGVAYRLTPEVEALAMLGYAGLPVRGKSSGDHIPPRYWHDDASFDVALHFRNKAETHTTGVGFRRLPLPVVGYISFLEYELMNNFYLNFQDRSIARWFLLGFDGDVAWIVKSPLTNKYEDPALYVRFLPYFAFTFWDIATWRVCATLTVDPLAEWHRGVETTITIAY